MNNFKICIGNETNTIHIKQAPDLDILLKPLPYDNRMQARVFIICKSIQLEMEYGHIIGGLRKNGAKGNFKSYDIRFADKIELNDTDAELSGKLVIPDYIKELCDKKAQDFFDSCDGLTYDGKNLEKIIDIINNI